MRADNSAHLAAAARRRSEQTRARAEQALRELTDSGEPVTVSAVAARARVSRAWLYTQPELRRQIDAQPGAASAARPATSVAPAPTPRCGNGSASPTSASANSSMGSPGKAGDLV